MITNRKENKCPRCGGELIEVLEISTEIDDSGLIRRSKCVCDKCDTTVFCKENYLLCDIEQLNLV
jgi:ribosomal protein S27AE